MTAFSRRAIFKGLISSFALSAAAQESRATTHSSIRVGAIRWDAWYGAEQAPRSSEWYASHDLDPPQYQKRAPFFAKRVSASRLMIDGTQRDMDTEIIDASSAGIDYWAFGWYSPGRPLHNAWELYKKSAYKERVNWCVLIGLNSLAQKYPSHAELLTFFRDVNYERVSGRPALFVMHEKSDLALARQSLEDLRRTSVSAGFDPPYVVLQCPVPLLAATEASSVGADAVSAYAFAPPIKHRTSYSELDASVRRFWAELAKTGMPVIPNGMTGWDLRPRIELSPPFDHPNATMDQYVAPGTAQEIGKHIGALLDFIRENPGPCSPMHAIIYSWNEFDEGGSALCPNWTENGPDDRILTAVKEAIRNR